MLPKNKIKLISSLAHKKYREETGLFVAEGIKLVRDLADSFHCELLISTHAWEKEVRMLSADEHIVIEDKLMHHISTQKSPQGLLALFRKRTEAIPTQAIIQNRLILAIDDIQDPGNMGTIIRLADWFGIQHIFCSELTADAYGPKVVQASMGALARVNVHYVDLYTFLSGLEELTIYGTFLEGNSIYTAPLSSNGVLVMGNEGNGISSQIELLITQKLLIPNFPKGLPTSESLNVAVATAIVCSEFRRRV